MIRSIRVSAIAIFVLVLAPVTAIAAQPFRFPEAKCDKGELKYVGSVPLLTVRGTPEEIGKQVGTLGLKPAAGLFDQVQEFLKSVRLEMTYPVLVKMGGFMVPQFPRDHLAELEATSKASGLSRDLLVFGNTVTDLMKFGGCSTLAVEPDQSDTGGPLFGRNLDWPPFGQLPELTLVTVYRPDGKHVFASIGFPGIVGCVTGMNDAGLAVAVLEVNQSNDKSLRFDPLGVPYLFIFRRILEECSTIDEAEKLLNSVKRTTMFNLAVCDTTKGVVFEVTTKSVAVRQSQDGICACTNHFRTPGLVVDATSERYAFLEKNRGLKNITVSDVAKQLHAVNQGTLTLQTMVFETQPRRLHLAFGAGPASRLPLTTIELSHLMKPGDPVKKPLATP